LFASRRDLDRWIGLVCGRARRIRRLDPSEPSLFRSITVSPFPEDDGKVLYLGGFDTNVQPCHNSAWIQRVGFTTAMQPYGG
jgi:hypothetical protein